MVGKILSRQITTVPAGYYRQPDSEQERLYRILVQAMDASTLASIYSMRLLVRYGYSDPRFQRSKRLVDRLSARYWRIARKLDAKQEPR